MALWGIIVMRRSYWLLPLLGLLVAGCVPTVEHGLLAGRAEITKQDIRSLKVGNTTREDVLLRFGEPDSTRYQNQQFPWAQERDVLG